MTTLDATREQATRPVTFDNDTYPMLSKYASFIHAPDRPVIGREREIRRLLASLNRAELSNAFLLGDAGSGKTMLVQGVSAVDTKRVYVEVDLSKMAASDQGEDGAVQMASRIKGLFDEAMNYKLAQQEVVQNGGTEVELVMFIDEFHLLVQLSPAAAQAIKPILAESGRRGVKIIAATTFAEFHEYVEKDQALMQRLQRINIREPEKEVVLSILRSIAESHDVLSTIYDDQLFELIYEHSNRYIPADSQPRKSILMLDSMIGWCRAYPGEFKLDRHLLADVIYDNTGIKVAFEIDGRAVEAALNKRVFSQRFAMKALEQRIQIAVADLHDKNRPISSFLFTGATGTGKTETVKALAELLFQSEKRMIRFDMSEYALDDSLDRFREELTSQVWNQSHSVVLFDEVEKASPAITRLLLQVLDDGRLSNAQGREVGFLNTYIVLTTNAGSEIYKDIAHHVKDDSGENGLAEYDKVIRRSLIANASFAPEIINRMNGIIPFQPLSEATYEKIVIRKLQQLQRTVRVTHGVDLRVHPDVKDYLVHETGESETDSGGARGLVARVDSEIVAPLARYINKHKDTKHMVVYVKGDMAYRDQSILKSDAHVVVASFDPKKARRN